MLGSSEKVVAQRSKCDPHMRNGFIKNLARTSVDITHEIHSALTATRDMPNTQNWKAMNTISSLFVLLRLYVRAYM